MISPTMTASAIRRAVAAGRDRLLSTVAFFLVALIFAAAAWISTYTVGHMLATTHMITAIQDTRQVQAAYDLYHLTTGRPAHTTADLTRDGYLTPSQTTHIAIHDGVIVDDIAIPGALRRTEHLAGYGPCLTSTDDTLRYGPCTDLTAARRTWSQQTAYSPADPWLAALVAAALVIIPLLITISYLTRLRVSFVGALGAMMLVQLVFFSVDYSAGLWFAIGALTALALGGIVIWLRPA